MSQATFTSSTSRRRFLTAAAALASPVAAVPALAAVTAPDPVFVAIERHREAWKAHEAACGVANDLEEEAIAAGLCLEDHPDFEATDERWDQACNAEDEALRVLCATTATTVAGAAALASYVAAYCRRSGYLHHWAGGHWRRLARPSRPSPAWTGSGARSPQRRERQARAATRGRASFRLPCRHGADMVLRITVLRRAG
jgi:hypothetical protein